MWVSRYDYGAHCCVFNSRPYFDFTDDDSTPTWQQLETILTTWIEMIKRCKAVVVHKSLRYDEVDVESGITRDGMKEPWGWAPYTRIDVENTIEAWNKLLEAINERLPDPQAGTCSSTTTGLFEVNALDEAGIREESCAWQFFRKARRPSFQFLGPGLQLPSWDQLMYSPFDAAWNARPPNYLKPTSFPLPIFLGQQRAKSWVEGYQFEAGPAPWGLYLDKSHSGGVCSYEDASRLVLLFEPDEATGHRMLDGKPAMGNHQLFQIDRIPSSPIIRCNYATH